MQYDEHIKDHEFYYLMRETERKRIQEYIDKGLCVSFAEGRRLFRARARRFCWEEGDLELVKRGGE